MHVPYHYDDHFYEMKTGNKNVNTFWASGMFT